MLLACDGADDGNLESRDAPSGNETPLSWQECVDKGGFKNSCSSSGGPAFAWCAAYCPAIKGKCGGEPCPPGGLAGVGWCAEGMEGKITFEECASQLCLFYLAPDLMPCL